jgi:signal peptidase I
MILSIFRKKRQLTFAKKVYNETTYWLCKKHDTLTKAMASDILKSIAKLKNELQNKNAESAFNTASEIQQLSKHFIKPNFAEKSVYHIKSIGLLLVAVVILRTTVGEFSYVPTGSMRPTILEKDLALINRSSFAINIPFRTGHLQFDKNRCLRGSITSFTSEGLPVDNNQYNLYGIIPAVKTFVKRLVALPGDTVYFYGGQIYGVDQDGKFISEYIDSPTFNTYEHIPFMHFFGQKSHYKRNVQTYKHFNVDYMRVEYGPANKVTEIQHLQSPDSSGVIDMWGLNNYGKVRLLNFGEFYRSSLLVQKDNILKGYSDAQWYFEIQHNPQIVNNGIQYCYSIIPAYDIHLERLFKTLNTARFVVKSEIATKYDWNNKLNMEPLTLKGVPDGTYEFINGIAYSVSELPFFGQTTQLDKSHHLYKQSVQIKLFNAGVHFINYFLKQMHSQSVHQRFENRFTYHRNDDMCMFNTIIYSKDDPILKNFNAIENNRQNQSNHIAFVDKIGSNLANKDTAVNFIREKGFHINKEDNKYLLMGDNHTASNDCRVFGCVPEKNLLATLIKPIFPPSAYKRPFYNTAPPFFFSVSMYYILFVSTTIGAFVFYFKQKRKKHINRLMKTYSV